MKARVLSKTQELGKGTLGPSMVLASGVRDVGFLHHGVFFVFDEGLKGG
jgi:hypothetical protein